MCLPGIAAVLMSFLAVGAFAQDEDEGPVEMRWDIISIKVEVTGPTTRNQIWDVGGTGSPQAVDGSKIRLTGSGTFSTAGPKTGPQFGFSPKVAGGGTWETFDSKGNSTGKGAYEVVSLVRFFQVPGRVLSPFTSPLGNTVTIVDRIGGLADARGGLGVFRVEFTDESGNESEGLLTVNCFVSTSPAQVQGQEGVEVIKGFVNYFRMSGPIIYHVLGKEPESEE